MANYLLLYHGGSMAETPEERDQIMGAWNAWFGQLGDVLVDGGNPASGSRTIAANGSVSTDAAGPTGYSILKADSFDDAVMIAQGCPVLKGGAAVQVVETMNAM